MREGSRSTPGQPAPGWGAPHLRAAGHATRDFLIPPHIHSHPFLCFLWLVMQQLPSWPAPVRPRDVVPSRKRD